MANQPESAVYDAGVYQLEVTDPVQGGVGGVSNAPLLSLAKRTAYLKAHVDALETTAVGLATLNSPVFTGTPTTPTPPLGDSSQKIPSTAWVQNTVGGILNKSVAGASNVSMTTVEAGNGIFLFTGVITANIAVIVPSTSKYWVVANRTTGNFSLTVKTAAGTGVVIPQGLAVVVYCDGTNVFLASSAGQQSFTPYLFSPAAGTTSLSITNGYTPGCVMVEKNGALLRTSDYTATNGTTIVIPSTVAGDQFTVYAFSSFSIANAVQKSGDVMAGPLTGPSSTSEATSGLIELASTAEAQAMTDDLRAMTPKKLADAFKGGALNMATTGYQKLPSGLILQWGSGPSGAGDITVVYPLVFPTAVFIAVASSGYTPGSGVTGYVSAFDASSRSSFVARNSNSNLGWYWIALGY